MIQGKTNPEHILQSECVRWYSANHNGKPNALFATFQETMNPIKGGIMVSLGLKKGVSDLIYCPNRSMIGIEMKIEGSRHSTDHVRKQSQWLIDVCSDGYFCTSIDGFVDIIDIPYNDDIKPYSLNAPGIYSPVKVLDYLSNINTKTFKWEIK